MLYPTVVRPYLFKRYKDPESAHEMALAALARLQRIKPLLRIVEGLLSVPDPRLSQELMGLTFPNPIGLAGGFDKNGVAIPALAALGFGFLEAGTVTRHGQEGHPRPRIHRLEDVGGPINKMGFPNEGAGPVSDRLKLMRSGHKVRVPVGVNIGKSAKTPMDQLSVIDDYLYTLMRCWEFIDFITVNVSSPNTEGLRALQEGGALASLLGAVIRRRDDLAGPGFRKPVLVKFAPDMSRDMIRTSVKTAMKAGVSGVIATNTTLARDMLDEDPKLEGGLSGTPLRSLAVKKISQIHQITRGRIPIIGVGGARNLKDVLAMFQAGASFVQVYTGFIYEGPLLARRLNQGLVAHMDEHKLSNVEDIRLNRYGTE